MSDSPRIEARFEVAMPGGTLTGFVGPRGLVALSLPDRPAPDGVDAAVLPLVTAHPARTQLVEYFAGRRTAFDLELDLSGVTPFRVRVYDRLLNVEFGATTTYGGLARAIGSPGASRAIGGAVGANPLPVVIPCHRVLAAGGALGGFTGGLAHKRTLLRLEGVSVPSSSA